MTKEKCLEQSKNRVSFVCLRSAELRKEENISNHDAFVKANQEYKIG